MLDFIARVFRTFVEILLWVLLIGFIVAGAIVGYEINNGIGGFLGFIIGGILGLVSVILSGGLIANFLNMVDNIEEQNDLLRDLLRNYNSSVNILPEIPKVTDEERIRNNIIKLHKQGWSIEEINKTLNIDFEIINKIINSL